MAKSILNILSKSKDNNIVYFKKTSHKKTLKNNVRSFYGNS